MPGCEKLEKPVPEMAETMSVLVRLRAIIDRANAEAGGAVFASLLAFLRFGGDLADIAFPEYDGSGRVAARP